MSKSMTIDGIKIDPRLPKNFFATDNATRPHSPWWDVPFILTQGYFGPDTAESREAWLRAWPTGTRYDVYCLDGGAWDRPTVWGKFGSLAEALECARAGR